MKKSCILIVTVMHTDRLAECGHRWCQASEAIEKRASIMTAYIRRSNEKIQMPFFLPINLKSDLKLPRLRII